MNQREALSKAGRLVSVYKRGRDEWVVTAPYRFTEPHGRTRSEIVLHSHTSAVQRAKRDRVGLALCMLYADRMAESPVMSTAVRMEMENMESPDYITTGKNAREILAGAVASVYCAMS